MAGVKEKVASLLRSQRGDFISGEEIAKATGVSRAAVWKCIKTLKDEGFKIESVTNKGYRFLSCEDNIASDGIKAFLSEKTKSRLNINTVRSIGSTNKEVKNVALSGEGEGYLLACGHQSEGKGRLGRSFYSPEDTGVYMSLLLRPSIKPQNAVLITTAAAVSVCNALTRLGVENASVKWVNDIFIGDKKVCGILTEAAFDIENNMLDHAILGVGINMYPPKEGFPEDIKAVAGAVFTEREEDLRNRFIAFFVESFMEYYENLENKAFMEEYSRRCFVLGKDIHIIRGSEITRAKAVSLDENCGLIVKKENGETETISSGEISVRPVSGNI